MFTKTKIYLASPHIGGVKQKVVNEAFETNFKAPLCTYVDGFENDLKEYLGSGRAVTVLNSGTTATTIQLELQLLNLSKDDVVLCQSFTFAPSANPNLYQVAVPVLID